MHKWFSSDRPMTARNLFFRRIDNLNELDEIEKKFFSSIQLPNGTYKNTYTNRLDDVNHLVIQHLKSTGKECNRVMDIGISSGVSTKELYEIMVKNDFNVIITGIDLIIKSYIVKLFPNIYALVDKEGNPLQLDFNGNSIGHWYTRSTFPKIIFKKLFFSIYTAFFQRKIKKMIGEGASLRITEVTLLSHRLSIYDDIHLFEYNILERFPKQHRKRYDYIRVANTLNKSYFSSDEIRLAVGNLKECLKGPDSILCIVRTDEDGINNGSIYCLDGQGILHNSLTIGTSEIDNLL